ncbi:MAG: hypothetical protein IJB42_06500 [Oscillospiraceae bacterium]|nr:hypothetical protein [Oscillospiraceae bacterium]MBQ3225344.1 hypothetical protein [Oscillospiraceae bacterium]MBQ6697603.1 hypothetical protein [Oscillospiraceae bacterium]MBQ7053880.1 hypothetical protein [Oscillospiraceae bacterium]
MNIDFTSKQFRRLLDLAYIGNWVLNSARGNDRIPDFDEVESYLFSQCPKFDMNTLFEEVDGEILPSKAFSEGGIHEAIMDYEDTVFFEILAEELAHRDITEGAYDSDELVPRREAYIREFERNGVTNISVDADL